jgi:hypothetical protein
MSECESLTRNGDTECWWLLNLSLCASVADVAVAVAVAAGANSLSATVPHQASLERGGTLPYGPRNSNADHRHGSGPNVGSTRSKIPSDVIRETIGGNQTSPTRCTRAERFCLTQVGMRTRRHQFYRSWARRWTKRYSQVGGGYPLQDPKKP